jgi:hypothetical protein
MLEIKFRFKDNKQASAAGDAFHNALKGSQAYAVLDEIVLNVTDNTVYLVLGDSITKNDLTLEFTIAGDIVESNAFERLIIDNLGIRGVESALIPCVCMSKKCGIIK